MVIEMVTFFSYRKTRRLAPQERLEPPNLSGNSLMLVDVGEARDSAQEGGLKISKCSWRTLSLDRGMSDYYRNVGLCF